MKKKIKVEYLYLLIIGIITFLVTSWTLRKNFFFLFDDIAWIKEVMFSFDIKDFFTIFPTARYNDRPLRTFWFWCMYEVFGLNYTAYYLVVLLWHVVNTYLVFVWTYKLLKICENPQNIFWKSMLVALVFGIYPKHLMAVYWIAGAANDLLCAFFCLLSMILYLRYMENRKNWLSALFSIAFYICAMRSKEAAICLPIIILLFEIYVSCFIKKARLTISIYNAIAIIYMLLYLIRILTLPIGVTLEGQYEQKFSISTILGTLLNYIRMYFAWDDGSFSYSIGNYSTRVGNIGILVCVVIISFCVINILRKKNVRQNTGIVLALLAVGLAMAPLLVLPNIQHLLYFYFPAIFLSLLFGSVLYHGAIFLFDYKYAPGVICSITMLLLVVLNNVGGAKIIRENFIQWGEEALSTVEDISEIKKMPEGSHIYIYGADEGVNVFNYAPGYIINIMYEDNTLIPEYGTDKTKYIAPYAIWKYAEGHVIEIERFIDE